MRIAVMATGAVGGYFGARLAQAGHQVAFVARGRQLEALRAHGLRVDSPLGDVHLPDIEVTDDPAGIGPVDLVLFTVKLWDTQEAAEATKPLLGESTAVLSFQNSVVKDDILRQALGAQHIISGVCYIAATIAEPGVIRHTGTLARLVFGEYDGSRSARVRQFGDACADAGIDAEISDRIEQAIWEEVAQVARAQGVPLAAGYADDRLAFVDQMDASASSSMHRDLKQGNRLEVDWLSGDVVERGTRLGVATPRNRAISDILSIYSGGSHDI
jgi:2-dehydropantoate 2-reductase